MRRKVRKSVAGLVFIINIKLKISQRYSALS